MERLTARNKMSPKEAYYPYCFQNDTCDGQGPSDKCDKCPLPYDICETLADYEDTGLAPEEIMEMKERDTAKAAIDADEDYGFSGTEMEFEEEFPDDATDEEIEETMKDIVYEQVDWSWRKED